MQVILLFIFLLLSQRSMWCTEMNFDWTSVQLSDSNIKHDPQIFYKIRSSNGKRRARSIADAVIESARCEHIELMDCHAYDNDEMTCMITATGMPCCICSGKLKVHKRHWSLW